MLLLSQVLLWWDGKDVSRELRGLRFEYYEPHTRVFHANNRAWGFLECKIYLFI